MGGAQRYEAAGCVGEKQDRERKREEEKVVLVIISQNSQLIAVEEARPEHSQKRGSVTYVHEGQLNEDICA